MALVKQEESSLRHESVHMRGLIPTNLYEQIDNIVATCQNVLEDVHVLFSVYGENHQLIAAVPELKITLRSIEPLLDRVLESDAIYVCDELPDGIEIDTVKAKYYAGVALKCSRGEALGVLSLLSTTNKTLSLIQQQLMMTFAQSIADKLELSNKKAEMQELEEFSALITNTNQDYIFVKDEEFKVVKANPAFINLHPESMRETLIGSTSFEEYEPDEVEVFLKHDRIAFEEGRSEIKEAITLPNGITRLLHTTKTRFEDSKGQKYILGVARDITEREELLTDLRKSNEDLDEFAYIASHDLKAPLTAIKRLVSWIDEDAKESMDDDSKKHFGMIKSRVGRMSNLLSDLLSYSRIGREEHRFVQLSLKDCVRNCFELLDIPEGFTILADEANFNLPRVPFELILINLLSNAIKHHDKSKGLIKVTYNDCHNNFQVIVSDDGPGIKSSMHEKVFERFQTLQPRDDVEGSGLGLAMVLKTVRYLGGNIAINSEEGYGAEFTMTLPKQSLN